MVHRLSVSTSVAANYPPVRKLFKSGEDIKWVAFGPDGDYAVATATRTKISDHPMKRRYDSGDVVPLRCASFGHKGAWAAVEDDGEVRSRGLSQNIKALLKKAPVRVSCMASIVSGADMLTHRFRISSSAHSRINIILLSMSMEALNGARRLSGTRIFEMSQRCLASECDSSALLPVLKCLTYSCFHD